MAIVTGIWAVRKPDVLVELERRRIERWSWPAFWRETRLGHIESGWARKRARATGVGWILLGVLLIAAAGGLARLW